MSDTAQFTHPKIFRLGEVQFRVLSYRALTDMEALAVIKNFCATRKFSNRDDGKIIQLVAPRNLSVVVGAVVVEPRDKDGPQ